MLCRYVVAEGTFKENHPECLSIGTNVVTVNAKTTSPLQPLVCPKATDWGQVDMWR